MSMLNKNGRRAIPRPWRPRIVTIIPTLFVLTVVIALLVVMREAPDPEPPTPTTTSSFFKYQTLKSYFLQDDPKTEPSTFDYTTTNFGLIARSYESDSSIPEPQALTQWQRFEHEIQTLNDDAPAGTSYRLLFLGRHGEGYHNVAERFYGTEAWDCHWASLDGNATITWSDARLTSAGISQALAAASFWSHQHLTEKQALPQSHYVSPLDRALHTAQLSFASLPTSSELPFTPTVKELLREANGIHTCDRRSSRAAIAARYPSYFTFEPGFAEEDELWREDERESDSALTARLGELLDDVFRHDAKMWISMTSHGGAIAAILRVVGHRPFELRTGAVVPVLVRVDTVRGEKPTVDIEPWTPKPECN